MTIQNPILPGFHPDPSILRVGDDYYLATSTFEWFPGVQIFHSRDLAHWRLLDHGLKTTELLNLTAVPNSSGIWAPSLTWRDGRFYLVYTVVRTAGMGRPFKDLANYLVTAESLHGPWSAPIFLHARGFDPSLFHDDDGRQWIVGMQWDFRKNHPRFAGIILQEYDAKAQKMVGPSHTILQKNALIEGPNLYRRNGYYYLMLAEGGTGWEHAVSMARAREITGPYELDPQPFVMTSRFNPEWPLQKAGHGELVETQSGEWYLAHLCGRPVLPERRCILGREAALQRVVWSEDGWLRLEHGGIDARVEVAAPAGLEPHPWPSEPLRDEFDAPTLAKTWNSLRVPVAASWLSLTARPGWLRLFGRESIHSLHEQSLLARRVKNLRVRYETQLDFSPENFMQMAGLIFFYDTLTHYYLRVTHHEEQGKVLGIILTDDNKYDELIDSQIAINDWPAVYLRAELRERVLQFFASPEGTTWQKIGPELDATKVSDDYGSILHFSGAFIGLAAQDLNGTKLPADFDYFSTELL